MPFLNSPTAHTGAHTTQQAAHNALLRSLRCRRGTEQPTCMTAHLYWVPSDRCGLFLPIFCPEAVVSRPRTTRMMPLGLALACGPNSPQVSCGQCTAPWSAVVAARLQHTPLDVWSLKTCRNGSVFRPIWRWVHRRGEKAVTSFFHCDSGFATARR